MDQFVYVFNLPSAMVGFTLGIIATTICVIILKTFYNHRLMRKREKDWQNIQSKKLQRNCRIVRTRGDRFRKRRL